MRTFLVFFFLAGACAAQLPTNGLVIQYDMLTTQASVLKDLSGVGNNSGTITGTTTNAQGRIFNGTSDWIALPQLIGNSNFTVLCICTSTNTGGRTWMESDVAANNYDSFSTHLGGSTGINLAGTPTTFGAFTMPNKTPDYDVYFMLRVNEQMTAGMISRANQTTTVALPSGSVTGTLFSGLGAWNQNGVGAQFWAGTIAYFLLYNRALNWQEMQNAYQYMASQVVSRPVFVHAWPGTVIPPNNTSPTWMRYGYVTVPGSSPNVLYDNACKVVPGPCFRNWYLTPSGVNLAESVDGLTNWTNYAGNPVKAGCISGPGIWKAGAIYYLACSISTQIDMYTSPDGITWTLLQAAIITPGTTGTWDHAGLCNPNLYYNGNLNPPWYLLYDACTTQTGGATSTNGTVWAKLSANPITGIIDSGNTNPITVGVNMCSGSMMAYVSGSWWLWCGENDINRFASASFNNLWIWSQQHPSFRSVPPDETSAGSGSGASDPTIAFNTLTGTYDVNGKTYMYYAAYNVQGVSVGIKLAIANMTMAQLVTTNEGQTSDWP
jgi:hypothetical protein